MSPAWPGLPWREWKPTVSTLHMWLQIVGKIRMALTPPRNHWWHVCLYVTSRGLTTSPVPSGDRQFQVDLDFVDHLLLVTDNDARTFEMALEPKSVARFYRELIAGLDSLDIRVRIMPRPVEVEEAIPFALDETHDSYDAAHAWALWQGLLQADRAMKAFETGFIGKSSPVHLFWGSFDMAAGRYSGRPAPLHPGGAPNCPDWVMQEAYSHEVSAIGWWPSSEPPGPAFYAYAYPEPAGYRSAAVSPAAAYFDDQLGEFLLPYDAVRLAPDPAAAAADFFQSTYEAAADLGAWDRPALEPAALPATPPRGAWTTTAGRGSAARR